MKKQAKTEILSCRVTPEQREMIEEKWNLGLPEKVEEKMGLKRRALIKRREFGDTPSGRIKMNMWVKAAKVVMRTDVLRKHYVKKSIMAVNLEDGAKRLEEARKKLEQDKDEKTNDGKGDKYIDYAYLSCSKF